VKYSNGHFGFSVQKQIYVECGGKLDSEYPGRKVWESFGDRVGWQTNGVWLNYSDLNPSLSSLQLIFPYSFCDLGWGVSGFGLGGEFGVLGWGGILFSRTETCEL